MRDDPGAESAIRWPEKYDPRNTAVHVRNELDVPVGREAVWAWLVRATAWPNWYPNSSGVVLEDGGRDLRPGALFRWRTFGVSLRSKVEEFIPPERLAWSARGRGIDVYHAWLIDKRPEGSHVLTEESQRGIVPRLGHALHPEAMHTGHQLWLERLRTEAQSAPHPPEV